MVGVVFLVFAQSADALIDQLGSDDPVERDRASAKLFRLESAAVPALKDALTNSDAEVRVRARDLLDLLSERLPELREIRDKREGERADRTHQCESGRLCSVRAHAAFEAADKENPWTWFDAAHCGIVLNAYASGHKDFLVRMFSHCMFDPHCHARVHAARALGHLGDPEGAEPLRTALANPDLSRFAFEIISEALSKISAAVKIQ